VPAGGRWGAGGGEEAYLRGAPVISVGGAARSVARGRWKGDRSRGEGEGRSAARGGGHQVL
jgi:hypothetical protein